MKKAYLVFFTLAFPVLVILSCSKDSGGSGGTTNCTGVATSFSANVSTLINTFCNQPSCHNAGSTNGPGPLTTYAQIFAGRINIRSQVQSGLMPQNTSLTTEQKNTIICWIDSGAPNN